MTEPQFPSRPSTATLVPMGDTNHPHAFAFVIVFPDDSKVVIRNPPIGPTEILDPGVCKELTTKIVDHLLRKNDQAKIGATNWTSVQAAIQRLIVEFNSKRKPIEPGPVLQ